MGKIRVGFNGMGRIGKNVMRVITSQFNDQIEIVAGNDLVSAKEIAEGLPKDSIHGKFPVDVKLISDNVIKIGDHEVTVYAEKDANNIPWGKHNVDVVLECTGFYLSTEKAQAHINAGAKKVIISAPCKDDTKTVVIGVNSDTLTAADTIVSNASCTTNCLAPLTKAVDDSFKVITGLMCTTHAATATQRVQDFFGGGKNRATGNNIIPASTGAAIAVGKVLPHLNGKLNGTALRVPTDTGSVVEVVYLLEGKHTKDEINAAVAENAKKVNAMSITGQVLDVSDYYECSRDCVGEGWTSMMIPGNTQVTEAGDNTLVKMTSFYDNEMGYSTKMAELAQIISAL
ncbi:MAG: glyceraldehyde 3-phosphate dehydrogenase NAD-binding domain-containing protein [Spirochaetales bacterium]|nr:glyceraldehyde 3-phosphate dehydrogenase NAD-binding domain-containing protein [Spirochaetales bacterium]